MLMQEDFPINPLLRQWLSARLNEELSPPIAASIDKGALEGVRLFTLNSSGETEIILIHLPTVAQRAWLARRLHEGGLPVLITD